MQINKKAANSLIQPFRMSLNQVQLSPQQVASLYNSLLIEPVQAAETAQKSLPYLGGFLQQVLIIVNKDQTQFLTEAEFDFLSNILAACKLTIADVAVINWATAGATDYNEVAKTLHSKTVLLLDADPSFIGLPLFFPHYQIQQFAGTAFLSAPSLHTLESTLEEKKKFWAALKKLFKV